MTSGTLAALFLVGAFPNTDVFDFELNAEVGFITPIFHTLQQGLEGDNFDYLEEGGQGNLFPYLRFQADAIVKKRHRIQFLYQPLTINTQTVFRRDVRVNDVVFPNGTPVNLKYGFPFYRLSYLFDVLKREDVDLSFGLGLQIRNADIIFSSADGTLRNESRNIGPVPVLKARYKQYFGEDWFLMSEVDGFWASGRYITGSENDFEGAVYDANLRAGRKLIDGVYTYLGVRFIGGGARGRESRPGEAGDGFTNNWLHTFAVSLGFELHPTTAIRSLVEGRKPSRDAVAPAISPMAAPLVEPEPESDVATITETEAAPAAEQSPSPELDDDTSSEEEKDEPTEDVMPSTDEAAVEASPTP